MKIKYNNKDFLLFISISCYFFAAIGSIITNTIQNLVIIMSMFYIILFTIVIGGDNYKIDKLGGGK